MNRRDWSIAQRLGLGFALILAVFAGLAGAVHYWNTRSIAAEEVFANRIVPLADAAEALERQLLYAAITARAYLLDPGADTMRRHEDQVDAAEEALRRLEEVPKEPDEAAQIEKLAPEAEIYLINAAELLKRDAAGFGPQTEADLAAIREQALGNLGRFSRLQKTKADAALKAMEETRARSANGTALAMMLATLLLGATAMFTVRSVRHPARRLVEGAESLARGNWQPALAWTSERNGYARAGPVKDEMSRLALAFGAAAVALERREQRLHADRQVAKATGSSLSREAISAHALRAICDHVQAEVGALYWSDGSNRLLPIAAQGIDGSSAPVAQGEGIPGQAAKEQRTFVVRDIPRDSPFSVKLGYDQAPPRCVAAVPAVSRDELVAVLLVASLRDLEAEAIAFLEAAAAQLAIGLQNVKAYEQNRVLLAELAEKNEALQARNEEIQAQNEEIQAQNEELQAQGEEILAQNDQLKAHTEQLRMHADALAEADRRKTAFLGVLAHELRNPIAAISSGLYTLANADQRAEIRGRAEQVIGRQTRVLTRLVDDLLDVTRIASGKVRLQKDIVELVDVVRECGEDYRGIAGKAGVTLTLDLPDEPIFLEGDRTRLCQIVGNLVDNAIKFSSEGQAVDLHMQRLPGRAEVEIRVIDQGAGMDASLIGRLFQPFSQADTSLARQKSGLGLGLALVKELVDMHGGSVQARSAGLGRGAEFIVRLPLAHAPERPAVGPAMSPAPRRRRILVIEDNADAAATLRDAMELRGHEVRVASDAIEGIEMALEYRPDVLLCDIGLPTMDGYQVARAFRADERLKSVFLIAVTGYAGPDDQERAARAGFDRHFPKPPDIERLQRILDELSDDG